MSDKEPNQILCKLCGRILWAKRKTRKFHSLCLQKSRSIGYLRKLYQANWVKEKRRKR